MFCTLIEIKNQEKSKQKQNQHFPQILFFAYCSFFKGIYVVDYKNERPVLLERRGSYQVINF